MKEGEKNLIQGVKQRDSCSVEERKEKRKRCEEKRKDVNEGNGRRGRGRKIDTRRQTAL